MTKSKKFRCQSNMNKAKRINAIAIVSALILSAVFQFAVPIASKADPVRKRVSDLTDEEKRPLNINGDYTLVVDRSESIHEISFNSGSLTIEGEGDYTLTISQFLSNGGGSITISNAKVNVGDSLFAADDMQIINSQVTVNDGIGADTLTIQNSTVDSTSSTYGIFVAQTATIIGSAVNAMGIGNGIYLNYSSGTSLNIQNSEVTATGHTAVYGYIATLSLVGNSILTANGSDGTVAIQVNEFADGIEIETPAGGVIKEYGSTKSIFDNETASIPSTSAVLRSRASNTNTNPRRVTSVGNEGVELPGGPALPPHEHSYRWETVTEPTAEADGLEVYKCACGDIKEKNTLSALSVFDAELVNKIEKCPLNGTVYVETTHWNSFGRGVKAAMTKRPDVTIKASFLSKGHTGLPLKVTIPAGRVDLFDSNGYLGLCRAGTELGYDN